MDQISPDQLPPPQPENPINQLFRESLANHELPDTLTPSLLAQAIYFPDQYPGLKAFLQAFGHHPATTYSTEYYGQYLPDHLKSVINPRYQAALKPPYHERQIQYPLTQPRSPRLQALILAHRGQWDARAQQLYYLMAEKIGPAFNYAFNPSTPDTYPPGDFHLLVSWLNKHFKAIEPYFFDTGSVDACATSIALNRRHTSLNQTRFDLLLQALNQQLGPVNLETSRLKKGKLLDPTSPNPLAPNSDSSIVQEFTRLYTELDLNSLSAVTQTLGVTDPDFSEDNRQFYASHLTGLRLLLLGLIQENQSTFRPLTQLSRRLRFPNLIPTLIELVNVASSTQAEKQAYSDSLPVTDQGHSQPIQKPTLLALKSLAQTCSIPGFGAPEALLHLQLQLAQSDPPQADQIETLMHHFNRLATDPTAVTNFIPQSLIDN